jgi:hypothetical protein
VKAIAPARILFVLGWKMLGLEQSLGSRIVTYPYDLVILCPVGRYKGSLRGIVILERDAGEFFARWLASRSP